MKILSFLTCEDVRQEIGGKITIVGMYDGLNIDIGQVKAWPAVIRAAAILRIQVEATESLADKVSFSVRFMSNTIVMGEMPFHMQRRDRPVTVVLPQMLVPIEGAGAVVFEFSFFRDGEKQWGPYTFESPIELVNVQGA